MKKTKRPSFQFYPADWLRDTALRSCSIGARGLWMDMICYMHEGTPYGYLKVKQKVILPANLARMAGESEEVICAFLDELFDAGVFDRDEDGSIYSKRMIRDEEVRKARADGGSKGGNPALVKSKDNLEDNLHDDGMVESEDIQKPTPSSSSSSSTSLKPLKPIGASDDAPSATSTSRKPSKGTRFALEAMPDDWEEFCRQERPDLIPQSVFDQFADFWRAKPGSGGVKLDWLATWRNWVRNQRPGQQAASGTGETAFQRAQREKVEFLTGKAPGSNRLGGSMPLGNVIDVTPINRKLGGE